MAVETKRFAPGVFCWADLNTTDPAAAKAFYSGLFGWQIVDTSAPGGHTYSMLQLDGKSVGALLDLPQEAKDMGAPPNWMNYVAVDNVDAAAKKVQELGGAIFLGPGDVGGAGRMAIVADPMGASFGLWQAGQHEGFENEGFPPGTVCWNELMTHDTAKAAAFYTALFGYDTQTMPSGNGHDYTLFLTQDPQSPQEAGMMAITPEMGPVAPSWMLYFSVAHCEATVAKAVELGGKVLMPTMEIPQGRFAVLQDPQGAVFGVMQGNP